MAAHRDHIIACACGVRYHLSREAAHRRSIPHRKARQVQALLQKPWMTNAGIAKRLGISTEGVRKIAATKGAATGHERLAAWSYTVSLDSWWRDHHAHPVIRKCLDLGYDVQPIPRHRGENSHKRLSFRSQRVMVNGHHVLLMSLPMTHGCLVLRRPKETADFHAAVSAAGMFIFPQALLDTLTYSGTLFAPALTQFPGSGRGDEYRAFFEAWDLLAKRRARKPNARPRSRRQGAKN